MLTPTEGRKKLVEVIKNRLYGNDSDLKSCLDGSLQMLSVIWTLVDDGAEKHGERIEKLVQNDKVLMRECPFSVWYASGLMFRHRAALPDAVYKRLDTYVRAHKDNSFHSQWGFVGVNDNMPMLHLSAMYRIGKIYGERRFIDEMYSRLQYFDRMLCRRTYFSEFNSPNYGIFVARALADIVCDAEEPMIKQLALKLEQKVLRTILALYHKPSRRVAGPFSRSYIFDETDQISSHTMLMSVILPPEIAPNIDVFYSDDYGKVIEKYRPAASFYQLHYLMMTTAPFHADQRDIDALIARQYPVEVCGTAEVSSSLEQNLSGIENMPDIEYDYLPQIKASSDFFEYPAGVSELYTYMTETYTLGTATKEFHNGCQTDSFHVLTAADRVSMNMRLAVDDRFDDYPADGKTYFYDCGRKLAFAKAGTAVVLYKPKSLALQKVTPRLVYIIHDPHGKVKVEIYAEAHGKKAVCIETDELLTAVCPVGASYTDTRIRQSGCFYFIDFMYEKIADLSLREGALTAMGAVVEIREKAKHNKADFLERYKGFRVRDAAYANLHTRYTSVRQFCYINEHFRFDCEYSSISEGIKFYSILPIENA